MPWRGDAGPEHSTVLLFGEVGLVAGVEWLYGQGGAEQ